MSRLEIMSPTRARIVMEGLYKDLERRIESSPPGLCPVDMARAFLELCHAQTCGKCVPCRIGLGQLNQLIRDVLNGKATMDTLDLMEKTALSIMDSADCAIGYEAANMVYTKTKELVPVFPKNEITKHIIRQAVDQLNSTSVTVETIRTLMNETEIGRASCRERV